ncbi:uncharacterized protein LOC102153609 [Canis lupus familiaris]|uniref:uncharacterized protein LOC102153609 n=1 Tax=Canis lupus familiaris TaxID=9615 RepID=UPI0018F39C20|nr:uncharacterized protein LOC102153609 [Canis lupus familiaris]XP_038433848.1 uncharacterized protein LOC119877669 [Canis lupus familiaris]
MTPRARGLGLSLTRGGSADCWDTRESGWEGPTRTLGRPSASPGLGEGDGGWAWGVQEQEGSRSPEPCLACSAGPPLEPADSCPEAGGGPASPRPSPGWRRNCPWEGSSGAEKWRRARPALQLLNNRDWKDIDGMELKFKTTDAEVCLCRETSFTADALRAGTRHTLVSCFKKRKETSLTPPPGQSYLLLPLQGHFQGVVCTACGRVLTSHSLLLGLLFGFQLHQSGETSGSKSAAISRPLLSRATSWSLPRAAASPGPRAGAPGVTSFRELTPLAPGSPAPRSWCCRRIWKAYVATAQCAGSRTEDFSSVRPCGLESEERQGPRGSGRLMTRALRPDKCESAKWQGNPACSIFLELGAELVCSWHFSVIGVEAPWTLQLGPVCTIQTPGS